MDIARLGVVIDPSGATSGAAAAVRAAKTVDTAYTATAAKVNTAGKTMEAATAQYAAKSTTAANQVAKSSAKVGSAMESMGKKAQAAGNQVSGALNDMLGASGVWNTRMGGMIQQGMSVFNIFGRLRTGADGAKVSLGAMALGVGTLTAAFVAIAAPIAAVVASLALISAGISKASEFEQYENRIAGLLNSFEAARAKMEELQVFAKETPYAMADAVQAFITLKASGDGLLATRDNMLLIGNAAAKAGQDFQTVANWVAQLRVNLQAGAGGGSFMDELAKTSVISSTTRMAINEMGKDAKNFQTIWAMVETDLKNSGNTMALLATTWEGKISNIGDAWERLLATLGAPIMDALKPALSAAADAIESMIPMAGTVGSTIAGWIVSAQAFLQVMSTGDLGANMKAAGELFFNFLETRLTAFGLILKDYMILGAWELKNGLQQLNDASFWEGMGTALYNIGVTVVNLLLEGVQKYVDIAKTLASFTPAGMAYTAAGGTALTSSTMSFQYKDIKTVLGDTVPTVRSWDEALSEAKSSLLPLSEDAVRLGNAWTTTAEQINAANSEDPVGLLKTQTQLDAEAAAKAANAATLAAAEAANESKKKKSGSSGGYYKSEWEAMADEAVKVIESIQTPMQKFEETMGTLTKLKDAGLLTVDQFSLAAKKASDDYVSAMEQMAEKTNTPVQKLITQWSNLKKEVQQLGADVMTSFSGNISAGFTDFVMGTKSAQEAFDDMAWAIIEDIVEMTSKLLIQWAISQALGFVTGTPTGGIVAPTVKVAHTGGEVGQGLTTRSVGASSFAGAAHFTHGGVIGSSGETPIVAEEGEQVLTKDQASDIKSRLGESTSTGTSQQATNMTIVNVQDMQQVEQYLASNPDAILNVMSRHGSKIKRTLGIK